MSFVHASPIKLMRLNRVLFWFSVVLILIWAFAIPKTVYADDESPDPNVPQTTQSDHGSTGSYSQDETSLANGVLLVTTPLGYEGSETLPQDQAEGECAALQDTSQELADCDSVNENESTGDSTTDVQLTDGIDGASSIDVNPTNESNTVEQGADTANPSEAIVNNNDIVLIIVVNINEGTQSGGDGPSGNMSDSSPAEASDGSLSISEADANQAQTLPDPQFCPTGTTPGSPGCTTAQHTGPTAIADALADATSDGAIYLEGGAVFYEEVYIIDYIYNLAINGGWDFSTNTQNTTSTLNAPIHITNTIGAITFVNIIFGANSPITLDNAADVIINLGTGDETCTLPEVTAINASNLTVDGQSGNDTVIVAHDIDLAGGDLSITAETITVNPGVMVSTRKISGANHDTSNSTGDSGDIEFTAQTITVGDNAKLYAHVQGGSMYDAGDITLLAENIIDSPVVLFSAVEAMIMIGDNVVIKGGGIKLKSEAGDEGEDENPEPLDQFISALENWGSDIASLPVSALLKWADALVEVGDGVRINASGSVDIEAIANASAESKAIFQYFSLGFAFAESSAVVSINSGAQITAKDDVTVRSNATSIAKLTTRTQMNLGVFPSDPESVAFSLAIVWSKVTSHATVSQGAVIISSAGNINIVAEGESEAEASAETGNYKDGRAGISISIELAQGDVQAVVGGSLTAVGADITDPDSDSTEGISIKATYTSSDTSSAEGGTGGDPDWGDIMSKGEVSATKIISSLSKAFSKNSDKDKTQSNTKTDLSIAGALAFSWVDNYVKTQIRGTAVLKSGMDLEIMAEIVEASQVASQASVEKPENSTKDVAISAAVAIGLLTNKAETIVDDGATLDAKRDMTIGSSVHYPYLTDWDEYWSTITDPLQSLKDGAANVGNQDAIGNVVNYFDFSLGIQEAFFNSWVRSTAEADELGIAGSVNFIMFTNTAETTIGENVNINQNAAYRTGEQTVTIEADILIRLINLAGNFEFDFSVDGFLTGDAKAKPMGSESEKGGVGGSIFILLLNNTARAEVETGAKIHTSPGVDGFTLKADTNVFNFSFVQSGGKAGQFGVSGMFSLNVLTHVTEALLADDVTLTGGPVSVTANDETININVAGAVVTGSGAGVGAAIAINVFDRTVRAIIGSADINTIGGVSNINVDGDVTVSATADGAVWSFTAAAALVKEEGKQEEKGTETSTPTTPELTDTDDPLDGISLPTLFGEMNPDEKEEQKKEQQTGVAIAGSVAFNFSRDNVVAAINQAGTIITTGAVDATADNETWMISASGSAAVSSTGSTTSAGLSGAFSVVTLVSDTRVFIAGTTIIAENLNVSALHGGRIISVTGGFSGAAKENGKAVAGSVSVNIILSDTQAYLKSVTATLSSDSSVTAKDETMIISVAGAGAYGGKSGVGLSLAINLIGFSNKLGIVVNRPAVTKAYIEGSTINLNGGKLDVLATTTLNDAALPRIVAVTGSAGISTGTTSTAGAGMISINIVKNFVEAYIQDSTINSASDVNVTARDDSWIISVGGAVAVSGGTGLGGAIGYNEIATIVQAFLDNTDLTSSGVLSLIAESRAIIASASVGVAVSTNSGVAGAGSIAINIIHNVTRAFIANDSQVDAGSAIKVLAIDISLLISIAGSVGASSGSSGVGAALSYNMITNSIAAFVMSSKVATDSTLTVSALSSPMMIALALGGGGGQGFSLGGSLTVNSISNLVDAHISGTSAARSDIDADGDVLVTARESAAMYVLAGAGSGSMSGASVGASLAYNYVGGAFNPSNPNVITYQSGLDDTNTMQPVVGGADTTETSGVIAYISHTDLYTSGNLLVAAGFEPLQTLPSFSDLDDKITLTTTGVAVSPTAQITNLTVAGSGAGTFAAGAAVSLNFIRSDVTAFISNSAVTVSGNITLLATDTSSIYGGAGSGVGAGTAAIGASVTVNDIRNNVKTYIDNATVQSLNGVINLIADEKASIISLSLGGAGAGTVSISGSVSVNFIQNIISAHISNNANVTAAGNISLSAKDTSLILVGAGNGAGSGAVAGAVAFACNSIANTVIANIDSSDIRSLNGDVTLSAVTAHPASFPSLNTTSAPEPDAQIYAFVVSGSGSGVVSGAISLALNKINNTVKAEITGTTSQSVVTASNGDVNLTATDASSIKSLAGAISGAGAGAVGVSWARNEIANTVRADISNAVVTSYDVDLDAETTLTIEALAVGGAGAGGAAAAGSVSLNTLANTIDAHVSNNSHVSVTNQISVTAADNVTIQSLAGGVAGAGTAAIGAAQATNTINDTVEAYLDGSTLNAVSITVEAESLTAKIETVTVGGALASTVALGGSDSLNIINGTVEAYISNGSILNVSGLVSVLATDTQTINAISGGLGFAGGAAVGAASSRNTIQKTIKTYMDGSFIRAGSVDIHTTSTPMIGANAIAGALSGVAAFGGSLTEITVTNTVETYINNSNVQTNGDISVEAESIPDVTAWAGGGGAAFLVGAGVSQSDATLNNTVEAWVSDSRTVINAGDGFTLMANANDTVISKAYSGAVGVVGTAWATSTVDMDDQINAAVGNGVHIIATNELSVTAEKSTTVESIAGVGVSAAGVGAEANANINMPVSDSSLPHNTNTVAIGANAQLQARDILLLAKVAYLNTYAEASARVPLAGGSISNAYAENKTVSNAVVNISSGASLIGSNLVQISAVQKPASTNDRWAYASAHAENKNILGSAEGIARTDLTSNTVINASADSTISTHNLWVEVSIPSGILFDSFATRLGSWGINVGDAIRHGDLTLNRSINFQAGVNLLGSSPILVIGADGSVEEQNGVTFTEAATNIIVDDISNNGTAATANFLMGTSVYDPVNGGVNHTVIDTYKPVLTDILNAWETHFSFAVTNSWSLTPVFHGMTTLASVTLINKSDKDFEINDIQLDGGSTNWQINIPSRYFTFRYNITGYVLVIVIVPVAYDDTDIYTNNVISTSPINIDAVTGPAQILIQNIDDLLNPQDPTDIILQGQIHNPLGITEISADSGNIFLQETARITSNQVNIAVLDDNNPITGGEVNVLGSIISPNVTVTGGAGDNVITVAQLPAGTIMLVNAGAGNDSIVLGGLLDDPTWAGTAALFGGDGNDQVDYYPDVVSHVTVDGGMGFDQLIFHLTPYEVGLVIQGSGTVDGLQGYAWVIPLDKFDNINSIVYFGWQEPVQHGAKVKPAAGIPVILVEYDQITGIRGYLLGVILRLPNGDQVYFAPGVGSNASMEQVLNLEPLNGLKAASNMRINAWYGYGNMRRIWALMLVSFIIPADLQEFEFAILFWDETANNGAGGWVEVASSRIQDSMNGRRIERQIARVNQTGIYILAIQNPWK